MKKPFKILLSFILCFIILLIIGIQTGHSAPYISITKAIRTNSDNPSSDPYTYLAQDDKIDLTDPNPSNGSRDVIFRITLTNTGSTSGLVSIADNYGGENYSLVDQSRSFENINVPPNVQVKIDYRARYIGSNTTNGANITNTARIKWIDGYYNESLGIDYGGHGNLTSIKSATLYNPPPVPPSITRNSLNTFTAAPGQTITFNYTINNPNSFSMNVTLGAQTRKSGTTTWLDDMSHDKDMTLPAGSSSQFRSYQVPPNGILSTPASSGTYDVRWVIFEKGNSANIYDTKSGIMTVSPPSSPSITGTLVNPMAAPGQTITFSYMINNPNSFSMDVTLGAQIRKSGTTTWLDDMNHDKVVTLPAGISGQSRSYQVPPNMTVGIPASSGTYDVRWVIFEKGNSANIYDKKSGDSVLEIVAHITYLDNGIVRVGVDFDHGGSIVEISHQGYNLVDTNDPGRYIQASFWDGQDFDQQGRLKPDAKWNPVQAGDLANNNNPVIDSQITSNSIYTKARGIHWLNTGPQPVLLDVYIEQWVTIENQKVKVQYRLTHFGSDEHTLHHQEFPAIYLRSDYFKCFSYLDNTLWTSSPVNLNLTDGQFKYFRPSEYWVSFVNDQNFGLTVYSPFHTLWWKAERIVAVANPSYIAVVDQFGIKPGSVHETEVYLIVGNYPDSREIVKVLESQNNAPIIDSINPIVISPSDFPLQITGRQFQSPIDQIYWKADGHLVGSAPEVIRPSNTELVVNEKMSLAATGTYWVTVKNSDGKLSNPVELLLTGKSIAGQVSYNNSGLQGVTLNLTGAASKTLLSDINGNYSFSDLAIGSYTIIPSLSGYTFNPPSINVAFSDTDISGKDFKACLSSMSLSGTLRDATTGRSLSSGISIGVDGSLAATTDTNGHYSISGLSCGLHTLSVNVPGYAAYSRTVDTSANNILDVYLSTTQTVYGPKTPSGYGPDPVNTATGNYIYQKKDLEIPSPGLSFTFERNYNSQDNLDGPLGFGWNHTYNTKLTVNSDSTITIRWGDGKTETWTPDGSGGYTPQYGVFDTLINNGDGTYSLKKKDQIRYNFDASGKLSSIVDKNANTITPTFTSGNLTQITDTVGRNVTLTYDTNNRITQITDPLNRTILFAYDSNGNLTSATDRNGNRTTYTYDSNHQVLTVVDPRGNTIVTNTYDAQKRVVTSQRDAKGGQTTYTYSDVDRVTTITDQLGQPYYHYHDDLLRLIQEKDTLGNSAYYTYDSAGNRTQVKDKRGNTTKYSYDVKGNVLTKTDALNNVTTITYDANNNPLTRTDALGKTTSFEYDAKGNLTKPIDPLGYFVTYLYGANGQPATVIDARGNQTTYGYDSQGNLATLTDALGNATTFTYDGVGRKLTQTDASSRTTTYTYDAVGNMIQLRTPNSELFSYTYDGNNNKLTFTDPKGTTTTYAYDVKDLLTSVTDPLNQTLAYAYDALDRRISETDKKGNTTTYTYDAVGNRIKLLTPDSKLFTFTFDANGNKLTETNPLGQTTTYTYDALNRLITVADPLGNTTTTAYDALGRVISSTNAKGQVTSFEYDALGRLTKVTDANGGIVTYTYDGNGNRLTMTDPKGNTTSYVYDALNRMTQRIEPLGNTWQFVYDAVGNRTGQTDSRGIYIGYDYDPNNRLIRISYPDLSTVDFVYDMNGNRVRMTDSLGTSFYTFDNLNRMVAYTNPNGQSIIYGLDANGNRTSLTYPDGKQISYTYDALNRMKTVTDWQARTTTYTYDAAGKLTGLLNPNQTTTAYSYDSAGRLVGLSNQKSDATVLSRYQYTLDALGNQISVDRTEPLPPKISQKEIPYTYDGENRLTQAGPTAHTYDANGNLINRGSDTFSYDYQDRLVQSNLGGAITQYGYDGLGNRLFKTGAGQTTRYVLDINGALSHVLAETDGSGVISSYYIYGLGLISKVFPDGNAIFYHYDSRGSTVALTDAGQTQTDAYAYDSFGSVVNSTGSTPNPFKFVGGYGVMDEGNGLKYIRARYYSPELGRFITKDPVTGKDGDGQSLNRYVYALNNPVRLVDVSGFSAGEGGIGQSNSGSSDDQHSPMVDKIKLAKLNSLKAQYDYIAALQTEAAYWEAWVNTLEGVSGALNVVGGLLTGSWTSVASGMVTMGGAFTQAAGKDEKWHSRATMISTGLEIYGLASSAGNFYKALDGRSAQARAFNLDLSTNITKAKSFTLKVTQNTTKTAQEAVSIGSDFINFSIDYGKNLYEKWF